MPDFKPGDVLRAETITDLYRRSEPAAVRVSGPISARSGRGGISLAATSPLRFVGVASGNISQRSGSAWGTGQVTRYGFDGTNDFTTSQTFDVVNPSNSTMSSGHGIDDGQYCWVEEDSDGNLVVTPLECS
jgi:hypothetical protein